MSFYRYNEQASGPSTPASTKVAMWFDNTATPRPRFMDDSGTSFTILDSTHNNWFLTNASTSSVAAGYAADTYLAGSSITIPAAGLYKAGTIYRCQFDMTKTGAGVATPILTLRMGTAGTTSDTSIAAQTYAAGTAAADTGIFEVWVNFRTVGSGTSAVVQMNSKICKTLTTTGLTNSTNIILMTLTTSSGFNSTTPTVIGLSFNGGTSFSGTNTFVQAELFNITI